MRKITFILGLHLFLSSVSHGAQPVELFRGTNQLPITSSSFFRMIEGADGNVAALLHRTVTNGEIQNRKVHLFQLNLNTGVTSTTDLAQGSETSQGYDLEYHPSEDSYSVALTADSRIFLKRVLQDSSTAATFLEYSNPIYQTLGVLTHRTLPDGQVLLAGQGGSNTSYDLLLLAYSPTTGRGQIADLVRGPAGQSSAVSGIVLSPNPAYFGWWAQADGRTACMARSQDSLTGVWQALDYFLESDVAQCNPYGAESVNGALYFYGGLSLTNNAVSCFVRRSNDQGLTWSTHRFEADATNCTIWNIRNNGQELIAIGQGADSNGKPYGLILRSTDNGVAWSVWQRYYGMGGLGATFRGGIVQGRDLILAGSERVSRVSVESIPVIVKYALP